MDELDVSSPRERELPAELARPAPLARPERFEADVGDGLSWIVLRGSAMASARIRLSVREPLGIVWDDVGYCGRPPRDGVRSFATVAIVLMVGV